MSLTLAAAFSPGNSVITVVFLVVTVHDFFFSRSDSCPPGIYVFLVREPKIHDSELVMRKRRQY